MIRRIQPKSWSKALAPNANHHSHTVGAGSAQLIRWKF